MFFPKGIREYRSSGIGIPSCSGVSTGTQGPPLVSVILWFLFLTNTSDCLHVYTPLIPPVQNASLLKIVNDTVCVSTAPVMSVILTMICKWSLLHIYTYCITKFDCKLFPHLLSCTVYTNNSFWEFNFFASMFYFTIVQHLFAFPTGCWKKKYTITFTRGW